MWDAGEVGAIAGQSERVQYVIREIWEHSCMVLPYDRRVIQPIARPIVE